MSVSIVIPTFNRKKFEKLIEYNINIQMYKHILEVVIADDSDKDDELVLDIFYPINYIKLPKHISIGAKRNLLACQAKGEYICHMDDDDIYHPTYIMYAINCLQESGKDMFGSSAMLITYPKLDWKIGCVICSNIEKVNEATMVYKKSFWKEGRFMDGNIEEGLTFTKGRGKQIFQGDIANIMVCICHDSNTVCKKRWLHQPIPLDTYPMFNSHKKIYLDYIACQIKPLVNNLMQTSP
jgi:glycosyltransferase involved in cell wall biosynthesis